MIKDIKFLSINDIHLLNKRNTTDEIIKSLDLFFDNYSDKSEFKDLDIVFIPGDIFDTLMDFSTNEIHSITLWFYRLTSFCEKYKIKLRIMKGTPSHDWDQSKYLETLFKVMEKKIDFKYFPVLDIEYIPDLDIHVLYVPDEWNENSDVTFLEVQELLKTNNIDKVDLSIMHGLFDYQLKFTSVNSNIKHKEHNYLSITRYFIVIAHIHLFSFYERIVAPGSFDRISFSEEGKKGGVLFSIRKDGSSDFNFIENKNAKIFKDLEVKDKNLDKALVKLYKELNKLPNNSYVRIIAEVDNPVYLNLKELNIKFPMLYFFKKPKEKETIGEKKEHDFKDIFNPITITKDNVVELMLLEISSQSLGISVSDIENILKPQLEDLV